MENSQSLIHTDSTPLLSSWDFIWSFFMYSPRVRFYLFQDFQPPVNEIINSFQNDPIIFGFDFPMKQEGWPSPLHDAPDIGDLKTVVESVDNTLLGYTFGNKGLFPIMPSLYVYTKNQNYRNAKVKIRRTAYKFVSIANIECFLLIEFSWMCSGVLAVATCYCATRTSNGTGCPGNIGQAMEHIEVRFFLPDEADTLKNLSACFDGYALRRSNQGDGSSLIVSIPSRIINPNYHLQYNSRSLNDFNTPTLLVDYFLNKEQNDPIAEVIMESSTVKTFGQGLGLKLAHQCKEKNLGYSEVYGIPNVKENSHQERKNLWRKCCSMIQESHQTGFLQSVIIESKSSLNVPASCSINLSTVQYKILFSKYGLSIEGKVQKLLNQLSLHYSKPDLDYILQTSGARLNSLHDSNHRKRGKSIASIQDVDSVKNVDDFTGKDLTSRDELLNQNRVENTNLSWKNTAEISDYRLFPNELGNFITRGTDNLSFREELNDPSMKEKGINTTSEHLHSTGTALNFERREHSQFLNENTEPVSLQHEKRPGCIIHPQEVDSLVPRDSAELKSIVTSSSNNNFSADKNEKVGRARNNSFQNENASKHNMEIKFLKCNQCGIVIRGRQDNLKRHVLLKHHNLRQFQCQHTGCGRNFQTRINLRRHEASVHIGRPFQCPNCTRNFKRKEDVEKHIRNAHEKTGLSFTCEVCGSCFDMKGTLNRHKRTVHNLE